MGIRIGNRCCGRNYFIDSITGVIPDLSCKAICGTVTDPAELPDPPSGCEFYLLYDDVAPRINTALYEWNELTGWNYHADFQSVQDVNGTFEDFEYEGINGWQVIVNGVSYTGGSTTVAFDNPVYYIEVTFVSPEGCRYNVEPFGEVPCSWYWDDADISGGFVIYPEGGAGVTCNSNLDIQTLQVTYPYLSIIYSGSAFVGGFYIYAPALILSNWEIDYGSGQVPMTWLATAPACPEQEFRCYEFTLDIDLVTYPDAILYSINGLGVQAPLSSNLLTDEANLETSLNEYLSSVFGGVITTNASYDGTTYTIQVYNVPFYSVTPNIALDSIEIEKAPFDYSTMTRTQITCS